MPVTPSDFYDELAEYYDLIFEDWEAGMERQGRAIATLLDERLRRAPRPLKVLDAAAGIGTQALPLAKLGWELHCRDVSPGAIARLRREAAARRLTLDAEVGDMRSVATSLTAKVDAVVAFDNSVPHLLTDEDILSALRSFYDCLEPGGVCVLSVRDYEKVERKDAVHAYGVRVRDGVRHLPLQAWRWTSDSRYELTMYFIAETAPGKKLMHVTTHYYAVSTKRLLELLSEAGFSACERLDEVSYQPVLVGRRP